MEGVEEADGQADGRMKHVGLIFHGSRPTVRPSVRPSV